MGTHYIGTEDERRALDTFVKLLRCADTVSARANAHLARHSLTVTQFGVLEAVFHLGPMCQRTLSEKLLKSGGNITLVVDNLEKQGMVRRVRDASDRRLSTVHLTDTGRELITRLFPEHVKVVREALSSLSPGEQEALGLLCRRLGRGDSGPRLTESKRTTNGETGEN
ncbi:MAG TPA: MarR family transcriptional regulator [Armatimonadota bacterium]|jgi:MarR family 2-MHQ and catechol resistance regulon transcriptional repressor